MGSRKEEEIGDKAVGIAAVPIQAEVAHDRHMATPDPCNQVLLGSTPGGKRLGREIGDPSVHDPAVERA